MGSLAQHLLCKYEVPLFLASAWYTTGDTDADKKRGWFVAHAGGASFRSLGLPISMTRKMERIFLASHDHVPIETAIRRAELVGLGMREDFVQAVLSTRLAKDLSHGKFWRTFWMFLVAHARSIEPEQIGPMIDFVQAIRHDRLSVETPDGMAEMEAPQPAFSMKGRTVQSMFRLMREWHRSLNMCGAGHSWAPSPLQPMLIEELSQDPSAPPRRWQMMELTDGRQLRTEGAALRHCVASYADRCRRGVSRIWSLRLRNGDAVRHVLTIEIDPKRRAIVQARGLANRSASGKPLQLLQQWAARERLQVLP